MPTHLPVVPELPRRSFLKYAGALGTAALLPACTDDTDVTPASTTASLGSGELAVLNYYYLFEQLTADFYTRALAVPAADFSTIELSYLRSMARQEVIHRDFLATIIARDFPGQQLAALRFNFSSVDFAQRSTVLSGAKTLEDLGLAAYNGVGRYLSDTSAYLPALLGISSVEARHAAHVSNLITYGSFANAADSNGLDPAHTPAATLELLQPYLYTRIDGSGL